MIIKDSIINVIILYQIYEWLSIIILLCWQRGKTEREIVSETMTSEDEQYANGTLSEFQTLERYLDCLFNYGAIAYSVMVLMLNTFVFINSFRDAFLIKWVLDMFGIISLTISFSLLICLAKKENFVMY